MKLEKGNKAPLFTLYSSDKKEISLEDYNHEAVVILFFPQAFTSVCTKELCYFNDLNINKLRGANIVAISVDSVFTLAKFKEENKYDFPLLSDFNGEVSRAYGCMYDSWIFNMKSVSKRAAFVVGKDGLIKYAEILEDASKEPNYDNILTLLNKQ